MRVLRLVPALLCAVPLAAQQRLVTDATYSIRATTQPSRDAGVSGLAGRFNASVSVGWMHPLSPRVRVGALATLGTWGEWYLGAGPRLSLSASPDITVNVTPTFLFHRAGEPGNSRFALDLSAMHRERIGISLQATTFRQFDFSPEPGTPGLTATRTMLYGGLRLGQKPGRYGILADGVTLGALVVAVLIACGDGRCS